MSLIIRLDMQQSGSETCDTPSKTIDLGRQGFLNSGNITSDW